MIDSDQLTKFIIKPALDKLQMHSLDAIELLLFTCAAESNGGSFIAQTNGPALGIYQIEPETYADIWQNYITRRLNLTQLMGMHFNAYQMPKADRVIYDLSYATAIARIHYYRVSEPLPSHKNIDAIWEYYKKYYNTKKGKADKKKAIKLYQLFKKTDEIQNTNHDQQPKIQETD